MSELKYALVDINQFTRASSLNEYIYTQITLSNWIVSRLAATTYLGVGVNGVNIDTSNNLDDQYRMFVNGSTYIQNNCDINENLKVYGDLLVEGSSNISRLEVNNLNVLQNSNIGNINSSTISVLNSSILNISVSNLSVYNTFKINCDSYLYNKLYVSDDSVFYNNVSINKNVNILQNISTNTLTVMNDSIFNSNISVPLLTVTNNASILNINNDIIKVNTKGDIKLLNVSNINVSNIANISVVNASLINISTLNVTQSTNFNNLTVQNNATIQNNATVNGTLTTSNLLSSDSILNGDLTINASTTIKTDTIFRGAALKIGDNDYSWLANTSSILDVQGQARIRTLYVEKIYTDSKVEQTNVSKAENLNLDALSVYNKDPTTTNGYIFLGEGNRSLRSEFNIYGTFNLGLIVSLVPDTSITVSTFNMRAKATVGDINNTGIIYNGPIQIGNTSKNIFNLNGVGTINYGGTINVGISELTALNLSSTGDIKFNGNVSIKGDLNLDGNMNLTGNIYSLSDIKVKDNITKLENCLTKLQNLNGYKYTRTDLINTSKIHIGLIAQEVEKEYPEIISEENNIKTINYTSIIGILIESIKELKQEINQLKLK
jgi:hypothetical protein